MRASRRRTERYDEPNEAYAHDSRRDIDSDSDNDFNSSKLDSFKEQMGDGKTAIANTLGVRSSFECFGTCCACHVLHLGCCPVVVLCAHILYWTQPERPPPDFAAELLRMASPSTHKVNTNRYPLQFCLTPNPPFSLQRSRSNTAGHADRSGALYVYADAIFALCWGETRLLIILSRARAISKCVFRTFRAHSNIQNILHTLIYAANQV